MTLTITQQFALERLQRVHPMPFYLERRSEDGVEVRDNHGGTVFQNYFHGMDDLPEDLQQKVRYSSLALAEFLVAISGGFEP